MGLCKRVWSKQIFFVLMILLFLGNTGCSKKEESDILVEKNPQFNTKNIRYLSVVENGEEIFCIGREPEKYKLDFDYWEILNPYDETATVDTEAMYELFDVVSGIKLNNLVQEEEKANAHIEQSSTKIKIDFVKDESKEMATTTLRIGSKDNEGSYFVAIEGWENQVYKIPEHIVETIYHIKPFEYILKIPALIDIKTVKSIVLETENQSAEIMVNAQKNKYEFNHKKISKEEFIDFYQSLCGVVLQGEIEADKDFKEELPRLSVLFKRNQKEAPDIKVEYYSYDEEYDVVAVNGRAHFLVNKSDVDALEKEISEYK